MEIKQLDEKVFAAGQIGPDDVAELKAAGFTAIVNNRPDGEGGPEQPSSGAVRAAAESAGLRYSYVPMGPESLSPELLAEFHAAVEGAPGKVLVHCRSGARSTALWALSQARYAGRAADDLLEQASRAGYELAQLRPMLENLRRQGEAETGV